MKEMKEMNQGKLRDLVIKLVKDFYKDDNFSLQTWASVTYLIAQEKNFDACIFKHIWFDCVAKKGFSDSKQNLYALNQICSALQVIEIMNKANVNEMLKYMIQRQDDIEKVMFEDTGNPDYITPSIVQIISEYAYKNVVDDALSLVEEISNNRIRIY